MSMDKDKIVKAVKRYDGDEKAGEAAIRLLLQQGVTQAEIRDAIGVGSEAYPAGWNSETEDGFMVYPSALTVLFTQIERESGNSKAMAL